MCRLYRQLASNIPLLPPAYSERAITNPIITIRGANINPIRPADRSNVQDTHPGGRTLAPASTAKAYAKRLPMPAYP